MQGQRTRRLAGRDADNLHVERMMLLQVRGTWNPPLGFLPAVANSPWGDDGVSSASSFESIFFMTIDFVLAPQSVNPHRFDVRAHGIGASTVTHQEAEGAAVGGKRALRNSPSLLSVLHDSSGRTGG